MTDLDTRGSETTDPLTTSVTVGQLQRLLDDPALKPAPAPGRHRSGRSRRQWNPRPRR